MSGRSERPDVRNPLLALEATARLQALPLESRQALAEVLAELSLGRAPAR